MTPALQNKVFTNLHISREDLLSEMTLLLIKQQLADYRMEVDFFEKKYDKRFVDFDIEFHKNTVSFEIENPKT
jgi:hypothetical protein